MPRPVCRYCVPERTRACAACGKHKRVAAATERGLICGDCARYAARGRPRCRDCRRAQLPAAWVDGAPLCSHCAGTSTRSQAARTAAAPRPAGADGCARHARWATRLTGCAPRATQTPSRGSHRSWTRCAITPIPPPSSDGWPAAAAPRCCARMIAGEIAISHEALDQHDVGQATAYLRSWLVAQAVLEPREELLARFDRWAQRALTRSASTPTARTWPPTRAGSSAPTSRASSGAARPARAPLAASTPSCATRSASPGRCTSAA